MDLIVIAGMPASGKTTYARKLSRATGYPIVEKDNIKEELFDTLGFACYAEKTKLDVAATAVLLRVADEMLASGQSMILVNNFRDDGKAGLERLIAKHNCRCVIVFFGGDSDVFYQRYVERDRCGVRHLGHVLQLRFPPQEGDALYHEMDREEFRRKFEMLGMDKLQVSGGTRVNVDATHPENLDADALNEEILRALDTNKN